MSLRWLFLLCLLVAVIAKAGPKSEATLCEPSESVIFSCTSSRLGIDWNHSKAASRKVISLCASQNMAASVGSLTYRFGQDKQHVEFNYPEQGIVPNDAFTASWENWAKGSGWKLIFKTGEYTFTLYDRVAVYEEDARSNGGGVRVSRKGQVVSDRWCNGSDQLAAIEDSVWDAIEPLHLPQAQDEAH